MAHNFAALEHHFDQDVWVHRKGATRAFAGEPGIIPGSQGSQSYIVRGLGNEQSFKSCSYGAGRVLGRKEAQRVPTCRRRCAGSTPAASSPRCSRPQGPGGGSERLQEQC